MNMNSQYKNISGCKYRLKQIRTAILLGFLLCGPTAMAQNVKEDMPAGGHEKYRKYVFYYPQMDAIRCRCTMQHGSPSCIR